jgi:hypothetical protein
MTRFYTILENAAETLAVPPEFLDSKLRLNRAIHSLPQAPDVPLVDLLEAGKILGLGTGIAELVAQGKEWLMSGGDICEVYDIRAQDRDAISGGPVFTEPHAVYTVSPFIQWQALDPRERVERLEGRKKKRK